MVQPLRNRTIKWILKHFILRWWHLIPLACETGIWWEKLLTGFLHMSQQSEQFLSSKRSERSNHSLLILWQPTLAVPAATEAKSQTSLVHCVYIKRRWGISHWITVCELQCSIYLRGDGNIDLHGSWSHQWPLPRGFGHGVTQKDLFLPFRVTVMRGWAVAYNGEISPGHVLWICTSRSFRGHNEPVDFLWCKYKGSRKRGFRIMWFWFTNYAC